MTRISIPEGCNPELATGIAKLALEISPSHSITSRRFSVWSLVRRHIDQPFESAIAPLRRHSWGALVGNLVPSLAGQSPSFDVLALASTFREAALPRIKGSPEPASRAESVVSAVKQWDECIRLAGRKARITAGQSHLIPTLDAMRLLLAALVKLRPRVQRDVYGISVRDSSTRQDQYALCDLCWRESLRSAALNAGASTLRARSLTNRFCRHHDPRDPRSQYRTDIRYKEAFRQEVCALLNVGDSAFSFAFHAPRGSDFQELRKTAYDLVHARLRTLNSKQLGLREQVGTLLTSGLSQSQVARRLGISRQAVSQAKKSLERILKARQNDAELSPRTGESLSLSAPSGQQLRAHFYAMMREGKNMFEIAHELERFRHSIRFLVDAPSI
jgi:DNA-binding CsgD family transcriptional regulator